MNDEIEAFEPFAPPRIARVVPLGKRVARAVAIGVFGISAYTVIGCLVVGSFVGPHGFVAAAIWAVPAAFSAFLLKSRLGPQ